jgi:outer membrane protein TolC
MKKLPLTLALCALCYGISAPAEDLLEVYRLAQQHDPKLREVAAQRDAVLEGKSLATARLLPSAALSLGGNYVFSNVEDSPAAAAATTSPAPTSASASTIRSIGGTISSSSNRPTRASPRRRRAMWPPSRS